MTALTNPIVVEVGVLCAVDERELGAVEVQMAVHVVAVGVEGDDVYDIARTLIGAVRAGRARLQVVSRQVTSEEVRRGELLRGGRLYILRG